MEDINYFDHAYITALKESLNLARKVADSAPKSIAFGHPDDMIFSADGDDSYDFGDYIYRIEERDDCFAIVRINSSAALRSNYAGKVEIYETFPTYDQAFKRLWDAYFKGENFIREEVAIIDGEAYSVDSADEFISQCFDDFVDSKF